VAAAACVLAAAPAGAERVEVEAVGVAPAGAGARQAAIEAGVREAMRRVAGDLAREAGAPEPEPEALRAAIGPDPFRFAASYRLTEDRGEQPARLIGDPGVEREHVVLLAVQVDRDRLAGRLQEAGLLGAARRDPGGARTLVVTVDGLPSYVAWKRVARALAARGAAVRPVEFARGRVVAELDTEERSEALVARVQRAVGDGLALAVVSADAWNVHLRARSTEAPGSPASGGGAAPEAEPPGASLRGLGAARPI
jgi:hypothetical protein